MHVVEQVLNIEDALTKGDALIRTFGKRMATDKVIQVSVLMVCVCVNVGCADGRLGEGNG
jgi:hypothetical protein